MKKIYKRSIYTKNDAGNIFFFALIFPALVYALLIVILPFFWLGAFALFEQGSLASKIINIISAQGGLFLVFLIYNKANRFDWKKASRTSFKLNFKNIAIAIVISLVALFGINNLVGVANEIIFKYLNHPASPLPLPLDNVGWLMLNLLLLAALPAITEELLFRGVVYNGLRQYGKTTAFVVSALLFALLHSNIEQTVYPILFGLILAYIVYKTGNIVYAMIAHFVNNASVIVFNYLVTIYGITVNETSLLNPVSILLAIFFAALALAIVYLLGKLFKKQEATPSVLTMAEDIEIEDLQLLEEDGTENELPQGADREVWQTIICQKNDVLELERARTSKNTMLWFGVVLSLIMWMASI